MMGLHTQKCHAEQNMSGDGQSRERPAVRSVKPIVGDYILPGSSLASVKVNYWNIAVGPGVEVPSPDIFDAAPREVARTCKVFRFERKFNSDSCMAAPYVQVRTKRRLR